MNDNYYFHDRGIRMTFPVPSPSPFTPSELEQTPLPYLADCQRSSITKVLAQDLSNRSLHGIDFAASILYAEYLNIRVIGIIPGWVQRLRKYPRGVPERLVEGVRRVLAMVNVALTDDGELLYRQGGSSHV